jgi:hypothetical protein
MNCDVEGEVKQMMQRLMGGTLVKTQPEGCREGASGSTRGTALFNTSVKCGGYTCDTKQANDDDELLGKNA